MLCINFYALFLFVTEDSDFLDLLSGICQFLMCSAPSNEMKEPRLTIEDIFNYLLIKWATNK